jgi:hypothetical protein
MDIKIPQTLEEWNAAGAEYLPGHLGFSWARGTAICMRAPW